MNIDSGEADTNSTFFELKGIFVSFYGEIAFKTRNYLNLDGACPIIGVTFQHPDPIAVMIEATTKTRAPQARGDARRQKLLAAAVELLDRRDLRDISLSDVAETAGIPLSSIYHFHRNVNELFGQVLVNFRDRLAEEIAGPMNLRADDQWTSVIHQIIERAVAMSREHRAYAQVAFSRRVPIEVRYESGQKGGWEFVPIIEEVIGRYFALPKIPNLDRVVLNFLDIIDILFVRSVEETGDIDDGTLEEAKRAGIAYLRLYLPDYLPRHQLAAVIDDPQEHTG